MEGGSGNDSLVGADGDDTMLGGLGHATLAGNAGNDLLNGGAGDDVIDGGTGHDMLSGGAGNDSLVAGDGNDFLNGGDGNDVLNGGTGVDVMQCGAGDDTDFVDSSADLVMEISGNSIDIVVASASYSIVGTDVETLSAALGATALKLTGNELNNVLTDSAANDTLDGGLGSDRNDTYIVDYAGETISDFSGIDTVVASVTYTLGTDIEILTAAGDAALSLVGNVLSNTLLGNTARNVMDGGSGDDTVDGGRGNDILTGGSGKDSFLFSTALNATSNVDTISDFSVKDDTILLENAVFRKLTKTGILKKGFFTVGPKAKDANDYIIYDSKTGTLSYDADGSGKTVAIQFAKLSKGLHLASADFIVI